jgi:hypothetical protein
MQNELDRLYCHLLTAGFMVLRQATEAQDMGWVASELELLHNIPSLIGETKVGRHEYFWEKERTRYVGFVAASGSEMQRSTMRTYYEPIWREMEPLMGLRH